MKYSEGKFLITIIIVMIIFMLFDVTHSSYDENKGLLQQEEPAPDKRGESENPEYYDDNNQIDMNNIAENVELEKSIPEEDNPKEAVIDWNKIDKTLLDKIKYEAADDKEAINNFLRDDKIIMGEGKNYSSIKGVTCFRGNNYRDSASYGYSNVKEKKLEIKWAAPIGAIDGWTGVGWNGQPAIVEWPEELREKMNIMEEKKNKEGLREVIYAALDGNVHFLDLEDGAPTREKIKIAGPVKGSVTVDPRGIPLLYVGQGINTVHGKKVEMGYRIFSLINHEMLYFINGSDPFAYRGWPAFDSTSLVDGKSDTLIIAGENGILYTLKLNTDYNIAENTITIDPKATKYRYKITGNPYQGIENSVAVYRNLAYFADNGGWMQCVNLNTMQPVWIKDVTDDTDSTIVIDEETESQISLYTACEVDKQGSEGMSYIRKIDALSGQLIWEKPYKCYSLLGDTPINGGALATPVIGKNSLEKLIIFNLARCGGFNKGLLVALDKSSGEEVWRLELANYSWSSPVDVYTENGDGYIILCDSAGKMHLIDGLTGTVLDSISLGANIEGSPAVFEDMIVVGTRGQKIFGVKIR